MWCGGLVEWTRVERNPTDWATYGRKAGFRRNAEIVDCGTELWFITAGSYGPSQTDRLAGEAGNPTIQYLTNGTVVHAN